MQWRNIGPFRGGRSVAVAGVASERYTYYFGGVGSGVWKTTDAGQSWNNVSDSTFKTSSVGAIEVAPADPNVVYVGMGEHAVRGVMTSHGDGVYRSMDAGRTWRHMGLAGTRAISRIRVHPDNPDLVYVAAQGAPHGATEDRGIYRSTDGGVTWQKVLYVSETAGASDLAMDPNNPRILYAAFWDHLRYPWQVRSGGPGSGVHKSTDGGDTWVQLETGLPDLMGKIGVAVAANSDRVYAIIEADPGGGLYRSEDAGKSWSNVNESWTIRARAWYYIEVFADPQNPDVVWVLDAPAMKSIDGGQSFTRVRTPHGDNHDMWINPTNSDYIINANDGGANVSLNGGKTWSTQRNQSTAQFYRVNTDNRFPYYVYGGQQDNSAVAVASRTSRGGIGWQDWYSVGGCESAYVAFDRDNPVLSYAGCYMGQISEFDERTRTDRNIMAYPMLPAALASRDMKYRFNWNAPILVSMHNPNVIYHAGNILLRSENRGVTWQEVSPDLTRNEDAKQGPGGGPITNEGAGGEIYNTIMYVAESPHDSGTIWVGSDDGLVHLTRDAGANWDDVTPGGVGEAMINSIEVSPHEPAVAYLAVTRYKFNDFTPLIFKTENYGRSWQRVVRGVGAEAFVRVVREDPVRRGLLYAGTETGVYVSWDDGDQWQSLQLNMPVTPITDLQIQQRHNDLVASTQGRGFWILDDLSPLQQSPQRLTGTDAHLFKPWSAYRMAGEGGSGFPNPAVGTNRPAGAIIDFYLSEAPDSGETVSVEILDEAGAAIRTFANSAGDDSDSTSVIKLKSGHNRFNWNLRHRTIKNVPGLYVFGSLQGRRAVPGTYQVRLKSGEEELTEFVTVLQDPRVNGSAHGYQAQDELMVAIANELESIHESVVEIRDVREQIKGLTQRVAELQGGDSIAAAGGALSDRLTALEDSLIQKRTVDGQTVINFPSRLNFHYIYLRGAVDGAEGGVTDGALQMLADLRAKWAGFRAELDVLLGDDLDRFNGLIAERGIPAIISPARQTAPIP